MSCKVKLFLLNSILNSHLIKDILLGSILDANIAESEGDILSSEHPLCIGALVHDINFRQDTYGPETLGVQLAGHLQTVGCGNICVRGDHTQDPVDSMLPFVFRNIPFSGDPNENETVLRYAMNMHSLAPEKVFPFMQQVTMTALKVLVDEKCDEIPESFKSEVGKFIKGV